ncbi:Extracellular serine protease precursor [Betaproteobacteria bacterium MOLA814]|nr:Extracellular serine protease precursor [Betaproteobacteria bacterium MOLA814]
MKKKFLFLLCVLANTPLAYSNSEQVPIEVDKSQEALVKESSLWGSIFKKSPEPSDLDLKMASIKASLKKLKREQLVEAYKDSLYANVKQLDAITVIYMNHDDSLVEAYLAELLKAARDADFLEAWAVVGADEETQAIVDAIIWISEPELQLAELIKALKEHPEKTTTLLVSYTSRTAGSQLTTDLVAQALPSFKDRYEAGFPVAALGLLALAGGGGGGGGGSSSTTTCGGGSCSVVYTEASFQTTEYYAQAGLNLVNAATLYSYGGSGSGETVAVFDTGILSTHSQLSGKVLTGYDYVTNSAGVTTDPNGHGTHVSGIIAASRTSVGMHGVAYAASILPIRILNASGNSVMTDATLANAIDLARNAGVYVNNHSWGSTTTITGLTVSSLNSAIPLTLAALTTASSAGVVQVWAAGNSAYTQTSYQAALPYLFPALESSWLAVMAVDLVGAEPLYTNRCGVAAAWCLAAPGGSDTPTTGGVYSTTNDGSYGRLSGTSMAAPHVAGAIVALKTRFPNLTYMQIRDRLLTTANKSGIYATSAIFGQGLMDLSAAASPVGVLSVATGTSASSSSSTVSGTSFTLSASLAASLLAAAPKNILVIDSYQNAPFEIALNMLIGTRKEESLHFSKDALFAKNFTRPFASAKPSGDFQMWNRGNSAVVGKKSTQSNTNSWYFGQDLDGSLSQDLGFSGRLSTNIESKLMGFSTSFDDLASGIRIGAWTSTSAKQNSTASLSLSNNANTAFPAMSRGLIASKTWDFGKSYKVDLGTSLGPNAGLARSIASAGAFGVDESSTQTSWIGMNKTFMDTEIGNFEVSLTGQNTKLKPKLSNSLLTLPRTIDIVDLTLGVGWTSNNLRSRMNFSVGKSATRGSPEMMMRIPVGVNESGALSFQNASASLAPVYDQTRVSMRFGHDLTKSTELRMMMDVLSSDTKQAAVGVGLNIKWN